ncbi:MAG: hypothetical protein IT581_10620 [Verrucomicrobiales bacterium]|nr:hypothetical protein [Verrucomicrobiales bacterium]
MNLFKPNPASRRSTRRASSSEWIVAAVLLFAGQRAVWSDYLVKLTSNGSDQVMLAPGRAFVLDVEVSGPSNEISDSAELRLRFSAPGLVLQSCAWSPPYVSGGTDDVSLPAPSSLPAAIDVSAVTSAGFPPADVDLYFSNLAANAASATPGRLIRLNLSVPANYNGPETITVEALPILFALGFDAVKSAGGPLFPIRIDRGLGAPSLPQPRGAREIGGNLYIFGNDSAEDAERIRVEPGTGPDKFIVSFANDLATNTVTVAGITGRIMVYGQRGDDDLRISDTITLKSELYGGPGDDTLQGGAGNDFLSGEEGQDFVVSSEGFDTFSGGPGQDGVVFHGTAGDDTILVTWYLIKDGQDPNDVVHPPFPPHHDGLRVFINGIPHEMDYTPQDDHETIVVFGGGGNDHIEMLNDAAAQHWNAEFHGEDGNDTLIGSRNLSDKERGNDLLLGGPGDDQLFGYSGHDVLDGGPGNDSYDTGMGVNRVVTDGKDDLRINSQDNVEITAVYPGARSATIDWGDGVVDTAQVDLGTGKVTSSHRYQIQKSGVVSIIVVTRDGEDTPTSHVLSASVTSLPIDHFPGALRISRRPGGQLQSAFSGIPGFTYILQATDGTLHDAGWHEIDKAVCGLDGTTSFRLPDPTQHASQFFRAVAEVDLKTDHDH